MPCLHALLPQVDGSLGAWMHAKRAWPASPATYVLTCLYPNPDKPTLDIISCYTLLPLVHKYQFSQIQKEILAVHVRDQSKLTSDPSDEMYVFRWLEMAERLQLDELLRICWSKIVLPASPARRALHASMSLVQFQEALAGGAHHHGAAIVEQLAPSSLCQLLRMFSRAG